jgi:hypothetical protein
VKSLEAFANQLPEAQESGLYWVTLAHATECQTAQDGGGARKALEVLDHALTELSRDPEECAQVASRRSELLSKYPNLTIQQREVNSVDPAEAAAECTPGSNLGSTAVDVAEGVEQEEELCAPDRPCPMDQDADDDDDESRQESNDVSTSRTAATPKLLVYEDGDEAILNEQEQGEGGEEEAIEEEDDDVDDDASIDVAVGPSTVERVRRNPVPRLGSALRTSLQGATNSPAHRRQSLSRRRTSDQQISSAACKSQSSSSGAGAGAGALRGSYVTLGLVKLKKDAREKLGVPMAATPQVRT